jgi:hypothetical protein
VSILRRRKRAEPEPVDERVTKRRVTCSSVVALPGGQVSKTVKVDFVRPDHLDAYVTDANQAWQLVEVSDVPDAGPGGWAGQTHVPPHLDLPDAGHTYPAVT